MNITTKNDLINLLQNTDYSIKSLLTVVATAAEMGNTENFAAVSYTAVEAFGEWSGFLKDGEMVMRKEGNSAIADRLKAESQKLTSIHADLDSSITDAAANNNMGIFINRFGANAENLMKIDQELNNILTAL